MLVVLYYTQFSKISFTHCYDTLITNNHAVLSTLSENPGDSRRSPGLQIKSLTISPGKSPIGKIAFFFLHSTFRPWNFKYFALFELLWERAPINSGTPL